MKCNLILTLLALGLLGSQSAHGELLITNGDFETGDFTGWTTSVATINSSTPLAGSFSATMPASPLKTLSQTLSTVQTSAVTISVLFSMGDPGNVANEGFDFVLGQQTGTAQIHLRIVDAGNDGIGDVQLYSNSPAAQWNTIASLQNSVVFGASNQLTLTIHTFGTGLSYDVFVNAFSATGESSHENFGNVNDLSFLSFETSAAESTVAYTIDNVSVSAIPEPGSTALLLGALAGSWLFFQRCLKRPSRR